MEEQNRNFKDFDELHNAIHKKASGSILIGYRNIPEYAGMVLGMGIIYDISKSKYELDLEWISFGLDLYGENLLENYLYKFNNLQELLTYLQTRYNISVFDIPMNYKVDQSLFPNPIKDSGQKPIFKVAWEKFQNDFRKGLFRDDSLDLVFSSIDV